MRNNEKKKTKFKKYLYWKQNKPSLNSISPV